jgi:hypothetical protein
MTALTHRIEKRGRPPIFEKPPVLVNVKMTNEMRIMFRALGGSKWVREQIEAAYRALRDGTDA